MRCRRGRAVARLSFDPQAERIASIAYPNYQDTIDSTYSILGDDSVLLKYLNPHMSAVVTLSLSTVSSSQEDMMFVSLIDTITGKIIMRIEQENAAAPIHSLIMENHVVVTYWNSKVCNVCTCSAAAACIMHALGNYQKINVCRLREVS